MTQNISAWKTQFDALSMHISRLMDSNSELSETSFSDAALELFAFQSKYNPVYSQYIAAIGGATPASWKSIPPLPVMAFKQQKITSFPPADQEIYFQTSGTTASSSGRHYFESLALYEQALLPPFKAALMPDVNRIEMIILTPPPAQAPHSSLTHMMETVRIKLGTRDSRYYWEHNGLDFFSIEEALSRAQNAGNPILIPGTAFAFVHLLDHLTAAGRSFTLPAGSRVMETGGFKGRSREIPRAELYAWISSSLGIPESHIVNEYGMTELSSQFYDLSLTSNKSTEWKTGPAWCRVLIVDPITGKEMPAMKEGIICLYDLANVGSCMALRTEDAGIMDHIGRLLVKGRISRATPRGCSIGADDQINAG